LTHKSTILLLMRTITITINVRRRMHKVTHGKINLISSVLFAPLTCPNCSTTLFIYASVDVSTQSISLSSAIDIQEFGVTKLKVSTQTLDLNTLLFMKIRTDKRSDSCEVSILLPLVSNNDAVSLSNQQGDISPSELSIRGACVSSK
jgi:hypothetical protein